MATLISTIITSSRQDLNEATARFWTDAYLLELAIEGIKDLWKKIIDLEKDHFVTIDETNLSLAANTTAITGVPTDLFRIRNLRPRTLMLDNPGLIFKPRDLTHPDFVQAQAIPACEPRNRVVYYAVVNAGAPVGAPAIRCAPQLSTAVLLTAEYIPVIGTLTAASNNPIPGESDKALKHFIIAFARAKERADRAPDPEHISIYATEARNLLTALTPRSEQETETAIGLFEGPGSGAGDW
jgi:hypothetical protein